MEYNKKDSIQHNNKDQMRHNNKNQMQHNNNAEQEYHSFHVILAEEGCRGALLLGDLNAASDEVMQSEHKVKTVITAASGLEHLKIKCDVTHIVFPLQDTIHENISQYFQLCYETIEQNLLRGGVLVHCGAGVSRSPTFVIAYCMKKLFTDFRTAFHLVKRIRKGICPNLGFEKQLKQYERELLLSESKAEIKPEQTDITMHCKQKELFQPKHTNLTFVGKTQHTEKVSRVVTHRLQTRRGKVQHRPMTAERGLCVMGKMALDGHKSKWEQHGSSKGSGNQSTIYDSHRYSVRWAKGYTPQ